MYKDAQPPILKIIINFIKTCSSIVVGGANSETTISYIF